MIVADEQLAARVGRARARFVEDFALALKDAELGKADIEEALQEQIDHGKRLLEMAEAACHLASAGRLRTDTRNQMGSALSVGVKAFRDLLEAAADWTMRHGAPLGGEQHLAPLIAEMDRCRVELVSSAQGWQGHTDADLEAFPQVGTAEWGRMNQRRAELIRKDVRGELSETEREEHETLQRLSLAAVEASFPHEGKPPPPNSPPEANGG
ncbi:MAG TPA: hypothetical protein VMS17_33225 [Gemmataceae bacterium]|nr:hypothetical protein [Gemmataceae bacterium]